MIKKCKRKALFDADAAGAQAAVGERCGEDLAGIFVFLPGTDFCGIRKKFAEVAFFERRADQQRLAGARDEKSEEAFAGPPVDAGEVVERGAGADEYGVE